MENKISIDDVRSFWQANPLCSSAIPYPLGTRGYFEYYDALREANESINFSYYLHEYKKFAGKKVLDVGSGNGYVLSKYSQEGAETWGVDITPIGAYLYRRRFELWDLQGNVLIANAEELPFENEFFDCVCCMGVLHHTPSPEKAVEEIFRVLKPGGRLIVMVYHRNSALYKIRIKFTSIITGKSLRQLVNEVDGIGNPKGDVYSKIELRHLLSQFNNLELFVGHLKGSHFLPKGDYFIPDGLLRIFEKRWGWLLYAKGIRR